MLCKRPEDTNLCLFWDQLLVQILPNVCVRKDIYNHWTEMVLRSLFSPWWESRYNFNDVRCNPR